MQALLIGKLRRVDADRHTCRALVYIVFLGAGCFNAVSGLKTDPGFTYGSLTADGIVVGGVTTVVDEPGPSPDRADGGPTSCGPPWVL